MAARQRRPDIKGVALASLRYPTVNGHPVTNGICSAPKHWPSWSVFTLSRYRAEAELPLESSAQFDPGWSTSTSSSQFATFVIILAPHTHMCRSLHTAVACRRRLQAIAVTLTTVMWCRCRLCAASQQLKFQWTPRTAFVTRLSHRWAT